MFAQAHIIQTFNKLPLGQLLTTRELLGFGTRAAIDQTTYRLVKWGFIVRVARGVFMRRGSPEPSLLEVAKAKAMAFGKQIYQHGGNAANELGFSSQGNAEATFACSGRSSSFRFGEVTIRLVGMSPRKLAGGESLAGKVIRAMWYLGKDICTDDLYMRNYPTFGAVAKEIHQLAFLLPQWMNGLFDWARQEVATPRRAGLALRDSDEFFEVFPEFKHLLQPSPPFPCGSG